MKVVDAGWAFPDTDEFMANALKADGTYQLANLTAALERVTDFSCALDGGAHVGTWTRLLLQRFTRVIAVEPSADTFEALRWNIRTHTTALLTSPDRAELHNVALGREPGRVHMALDERAQTLHNTGARYCQPGGSIERITIDSWALPTLGFLKLDVEGSEVDALTGAKETIRRCRPIVLFEDKALWKRYGYRRDAPQQLLNTYGYQHIKRVSCDEIWGPR